MNQWNWQAWNGTPYLVCNLLSSWKHGFFSRQFWPQQPDDLTPVLDQDATVCRVKQVHGNTVLSGQEMQQSMQPNPDPDQSPYPHADGLRSDESNQALWVCTADCTPVLIGDRVTGHVAAVHAGWRGTAARIVPAAIEQLMAQGSEMGDLLIAMGPAIAGDVYQVTEQVAKQMADSLPSQGESQIDTLMALEQPPFLPDPVPEKIRLDVRRVNALQLEALGIPSENIAIATECTYQDPDRFFSYRRDGLKKVQWSGIVSGAAAKTAR